jgi:hypothetical protein
MGMGFFQLPTESTGGPLTAVKQAGREGDHSLQSTAEVKNK